MCCRVYIAAGLVFSHTASTSQHLRPSQPYHQRCYTISAATNTISIISLLVFGNTLFSVYGLRLSELSDRSTCNSLAPIRSFHMEKWILI